MARLTVPFAREKPFDFPTTEHHRRQGRRQVARAGAGSLAAVHRRRVPPPRHARRDRHHAHARRGRGLPGRPRSRQADQAGRPPARSPRVRRFLDVEMGRLAPRQLRQAGRAGDAGVQPLAPRGVPGQHAGQPDGRGAGDGAGVDLHATGRPTTSGSRAAPTTWPRRRPRSSWACGSSAPSATIIRSSRTARTTTTAWRPTSPGSGPSGATSSASSAASRWSMSPRRARSFSRGPARRWRRGRWATCPVDDPVDRRRALANWLTSREPPWLARNVVNRYWGYLMGKGLVNPIDDLRETNPATNPELLDALAGAFVASGYDLKALLRLILTSRVYQLSALRHARQPARHDVLHALHDQAPDGRAIARRASTRRPAPSRSSPACPPARARSRCPTPTTPRSSSTRSAGRCEPSPASASGRATRT